MTEHSDHETARQRADLADYFPRLVRELSTPRSIDEVLRIVIERAYELVPAAEYVAITRGHDRAVQTVAELGRSDEKDHMKSRLAVRFYLEDDQLPAGLDLYAGEPDAFDESDETTATLLATHGALALTAARLDRKVENLERALQTSRRIGTAIGVLMATYKITDKQAFDLLRIASQRKHRKLFDIAEEVVVTGTLDVPEPPEERHRD